MSFATPVFWMKQRQWPSMATSKLVSLFVLCLLLISEAILPRVQAATSGAPIKIGLIEPAPSDLPDIAALVKLMGLGTRAALNVRVNGIENGIHGRPMEYVPKVSDWSFASYPVLAEELVAEHPDILAIGTSTIDLHLLGLHPTLEKLNLPFLGPVGSDPQMRGYNFNKVFNIRPDPWAEMIALLNHAVKINRIKRIAFMRGIYVSTPYGTVHYDAMKKLMKELGIEFVAEFFLNTTKPGYRENDFLGEIGEFLQAEPEAVMVFGSPDTDTGTFIATVMGHPLADRFVPNIKFYVLEGNAMVGSLAFQQLQKLNPTQAAKFSPKDRIISVFSFPLATDTSGYNIIREFNQDMVTMLGAAQAKSVLDQVSFAPVIGYITTRWIAEVLRRLRQYSRDEIQRVLYASSMWEVSDLTFGIFKGDCKHSSETHCQCNEGAHFIDLGTIDDSFTWHKLPGASFAWDYATCSGKDIKIQQNTNYLQLYDNTSSSLDQELTALMRAGKAGAESTNVVTPRVGDIAQRPLASGGTQAINQQLEAINKSLIVTAVAHSVFGESTASIDMPWPLLDPFSKRSLLAKPFARSVLHTHATLQQELHAVAAYAAKLGRTVHLVAASDVVDDEMLEHFAKSAVTFRIDHTSSTFTVGSLQIPSPTTNAKVYFVCGVTSVDDVKAIVTALVTHTSLYIAVAANEFHTHYTQFVAEVIGQQDIAKRLFSATNMPNWGPAGASTAVVAAYHTTLSDNNASLSHPLQLRAFIATRAFITVLEYLPTTVTSDTALKTWYDVSTILVDNDVVLGPYFDAACVAGESDATCECNVGPRKVRVFSMDEVLRSATSISSQEPFEHVFSSCRIQHTTPKETDDSLSAGAIAGVSLAAVVVVAGVFVSYFIFVAGASQRDTSAAPKDPTKPYTLVFTDIQSSTSLWARAPLEMGPALDIHHEIIRALIQKYNGYEVKTIGDAFMIAFQDPDDAVALCEELQKSFYNFDWGTNAIDATYKQLELEAIEEDPETAKAISCKLPEALYGKVWNGLRVRCGVHTGIGDIKLDEITKGYDYYGNVPNVAARTEAVGNGGQICITAATLTALSKQALAAKSITNLGVVTLRGVTDPVELHQVDAIPGRDFAPLRIDKEFDEDFSDQSQSIIGESSIMSAAPTNTSGDGDTKSVVSVISDKKERTDFASVTDAVVLLFSNMDVKSRRTMLKTLAAKWRVTAQRGAASGDLNEECDELAHGLAKRIYAIQSNNQKKRYNAVQQEAIEMLTASFSGAAFSPTSRRRRNTLTSSADGGNLGSSQLASSQQLPSPTAQAFPGRIQDASLSGSGHVNGFPLPSTTVPLQKVTTPNQSATSSSGAAPPAASKYTVESPTSAAAATTTPNEHNGNGN